jgi:hypothetical protein
MNMKNSSENVNDEYSNSEPDTLITRIGNFNVIGDDNTYRALRSILI